MSRHDHIGDETHGLKRLRLTIHGAVQGVHYFRSVQSDVSFAIFFFV